MLQSRFKDDLNKKISESEAAFKNAELKHEKEVAVLKAQKEKEVYLLSFIGLAAVAGFILYYLLQKRNSRQQKELQLARIQLLVDGKKKNVPVYCKRPARWYCSGTHSYQDATERNSWDGWEYR